jgi:uncharacterized short protein YbdD (DUF466 family)
MRGRRNVRNVGNMRNVGSMSNVGNVRNGPDGIENNGPRVRVPRTLRRFLTFPSFHSFLTVLRRIAGMPDYQRHLEHLQRCHRDCPVPTEKEYYEEFLAARYQDGPTRCC